MEIMNSKSILLTCTYSICDSVKGTTRHFKLFDLSLMAQISKLQVLDAGEIVSSLN